MTIAIIIGITMALLTMIWYGFRMQVGTTTSKLNLQIEVYPLKRLFTKK